jgi:hypothetical protein
MSQPKSKESEPLRCDLDPREALRRAMLVQPPDDWKKARRRARKGLDKGSPGKSHSQ